jgi:hypothetical protein
MKIRPMAAAMTQYAIGGQGTTVINSSTNTFTKVSCLLDSYLL